MLEKEVFLDVQCQANKEKQRKEDGEGCANLVKRGHIRFLDRFCLGFRQGDSVCLDGLAVTPTSVPFLQIDRVCSYADKDTIVQVDAVALDVIGELETVTLRRTAHRGAGRQECQQNCNAQ